MVQQKLLCLLLLATGRRIGEITHLAQKHTVLAQGKTVRFSYLKNFIPKHCDQNFTPKLPEVVGLDSIIDNELLLCPIRSLNIYLGKISNGGRLSITEPLWNLDTKGLTNLFRNTVIQSRFYVGNQNTVAIGPHQVRKFAASYSAFMLTADPGLERTLIDRMGCASMTVLRKNYIAEVPGLSLKCVIPVGTFLPNI